MRRRLTLTLVAAGVVVLLVAGLVVVLRLVGGPATTLEEAVRLAPVGTERFTYTDWAGVRREVGDSDAPTGNVAELIDAGFEADLTSASGLVESGPLLEAAYGWSPDTIAWELLAQSPDGAVEIVGLGEVDPAQVTGALESLGYATPEDDTGVWVGGTELLAGLAQRTGLTSTPTLQYVAVDAERGLLLASDREGYLEDALDQASDHDPAVGVDDVLGALEDDPVSAVALTGARACEDLAMGQASEEDQATAESLLASAGDVNPVTGFLIASMPSGELDVLLGFETEDQARTNADTRAVLAAGAAPGQGGDFADRFAVREVSAEGPVVRLRLAPEPETYALSDLSSGPVLFATC